MRPIPFLSSLMLCGLLVSGCTSSGSSGSWLGTMESKSPVYTGVPDDAGPGMSALRSARVCCSALDQMRFEALDPKKTRYYEIDASAPAYQFATGKSFFHAFKIPDNLDRATIRIEAIAGGTVFVPTVLVLDSHFRVTRAIDSDYFRYTPAGFLEPQRLKGSFQIDRARQGNLIDESYFVVFTTTKDLAGQTQMISEAALYARVRGLADPGLPNPVAKHAATGVIRVSTSDLEVSQRSTKRYVSEQQSAQRYVEPAEIASRAPAKAPAAAPAPAPAPARQAPVSSGQPMLNDTQQTYDRMIREAVTSGDMDRAWRLVQEAERAGSSSARTTFVQAVERK